MKQCSFDFFICCPKKKPIVQNEATLTRSCRRCGAIYTTKSRIRKRCDACQVIAAYERQQKANAHVKARRAARRALPCS
jgi:hypothetical protein